MSGTGSCPCSRKRRRRSRRSEGFAGRAWARNGTEEAPPHSLSPRLVARGERLGSNRGPLPRWGRGMLSRSGGVETAEEDLDLFLGLEIARLRRHLESLRVGGPCLLAAAGALQRPAEPAMGG